MNKKLIAVAVGSVLAAPAIVFAQASSVTIYGRANLGVDTWAATGSSGGQATDHAKRSRVYDSGSRLGFRITEALSKGYSADVTIETGVNIDTGNGNGQSGVANTSTGALASRASFVGLNTPGGTVRLGRQEIFWANGVNAQTGANYINTSVDGLLTAHGMVPAPAARTSNTVSYMAPRWGGLDLTLQWSPQNEAAIAGASAAGTNSVTSDDILAVTAAYTQGPIYLQFNHAVTEAETTTTAARERVGTKFGASYSFAPGSRIGYIHQRLTASNYRAAIGNTVNIGDNLKVNFNVFNIEHTMGQWGLYGVYARAGSVSGASGADTTGTEVKGFTLGAKYHLSNRTGAYVSYNKVTNGANAFGDLAGGGYSSGITTGALAAANEGADVKIFAVGMMHNF